MSEGTDTSRGAGLPYLIIKRQVGGGARARGPITAMNPEAAVKKAFESYDEEIVGEYDVKVYPIGVTPDGDIEKVDIHVGDVL